MFLLRSLVSENALQEEELRLDGRAGAAFWETLVTLVLQLWKGIETTDSNLSKIIHVNDSRKYQSRQEINFVDHLWTITYTTAYFMITRIYLNI